MRCAGPIARHVGPTTFVTITRLPISIKMEPPLQPTDRSRKPVSSQLVLTAIAILACLYFGREVLIPFALAVLISFLLSQPVTWLERLRLGRIASVFLVLTVTYAAAGALIWAGAEQFTGILEKLPEYQANIHRKIEKIRNPMASSKLSRAILSLQAMTSELSPNTPTYTKRKDLEAGGLPHQKLKAGTTEPVPVEIVKPQETAGPLSVLNTSLVAHFAAALLAIAVLTLFMLLRRGDLRDRIFRLFGRGRINIVTTAMDDAEQRVSRYLLTQFLMNSAFGVLLGFGLFLIGVPYSLFWGVLGAILRFIPYVGTLVAGLCPFVLALAVFRGWKQPLITLALWGGVELVISSIIEPWLYAARAGISSLAILLSAAFWTVLWGPIGLVLATPLTVCLIVLGRHVPQLEFLYILFGDEPVLAPEASYYQRLLTLNEDEAREVLDERLKEKSLVEVYDSVLIPALSLIEHDRHAGTLDQERQKFIFRATREIIEDLPEDLPVSDVNGRSHPDVSVLCVPARDEADELVGLMLAQVLGASGYKVRVIPAGFVKDMLAVVAREKPDVVFISAVPPSTISHARSICRRVGQRAPGAKPVIGLWGAHDEIRALQERLGPGCSDYVVNSLSQAELQVRLLFSKANEEASQTDESKAPQISSAR